MIVSIMLSHTPQKRKIEHHKVTNVTDGYIITFTCTDPYNNQDSYYMSYLHMNWGWGGAYNGFYLVSVWNPDGGGNFNTDRKMIYNITP